MWTCKHRKHLNQPPLVYLVWNMFCGCISHEDAKIVLCKNMAMAHGISHKSRVITWWIWTCQYQNRKSYHIIISDFCAHHFPMQFKRCSNLKPMATNHWKWWLETNSTNSCCVLAHGISNRLNNIIVHKAAASKLVT